MLAPGHGQDTRKGQRLAGLTGGETLHLLAIWGMWRVRGIVAKSQWLFRDTDAVKRTVVRACVPRGYTGDCNIFISSTGLTSGESWLPL